MHIPIQQWGQKGQIVIRTFFNITCESKQTDIFSTSTLFSYTVVISSRNFPVEQYVKILKSRNSGLQCNCIRMVKMEKKKKKLTLLIANKNSRHLRTLYTANEKCKLFNHFGKLAGCNKVSKCMPQDPSISYSWVYTQQKRVCMFSERSIQKIIHNSPKLEATQMSIKIRMAT